MTRFTEVGKNSSTGWVGTRSEGGKDATNRMLGAWRLFYPSEELSQLFSQQRLTSPNEPNFTTKKCRERFFAPGNRFGWRDPTQRRTGSSGADQVRWAEERRESGRVRDCRRPAHPRSEGPSPRQIRYPMGFGAFQANACTYPLDCSRPLTSDGGNALLLCREVRLDRVDEAGTKRESTAECTKPQSLARVDLR